MDCIIQASSNQQPVNTYVISWEVVNSLIVVQLCYGGGAGLERSMRLEECILARRKPALLDISWLSSKLKLQSSFQLLQKSTVVNGCFFLWNCMWKTEFATHNLRSYQPSHRTMVLNASSLYVSAALVPQNASKCYAEWSSHALFVLFRALWWHCFRNRFWKLTIKEVASCATHTFLYEMCEWILEKNQNVSCLSMFLVFTGFSARLGMTVTDKRSHGGRVQEQGEIVRSVAFWCILSRIATHHKGRSRPVLADSCTSSSVTTGAKLSRLLRVFTSKSIVASMFWSMTWTTGKTKCSNVKLSYPGVLEAASAYVSGTCLETRNQPEFPCRLACSFWNCQMQKHNEWQRTKMDHRKAADFVWRFFPKQPDVFVTRTGSWHWTKIPQSSWPICMLSRVCDV